MEMETSRTFGGSGRLTEALVGSSGHGRPRPLKTLCFLRFLMFSSSSLRAPLFSLLSPVQLNCYAKALKECHAAGSQNNLPATRLWPRFPGASHFHPDAMTICRREVSPRAPRKAKTKSTSLVASPNRNRACFPLENLSANDLLLVVRLPAGRVSW